jgi:hypothetical protein
MRWLSRLSHSYRFIQQRTRTHSMNNTSGIPLNIVLSQFKDYAPLHLADQSWDNVGLLVESRDGNPLVQRIFFTNDLTEPVLDEAIERQAQLIISYHPPIFSALKRLTQSNWKERILLKCIEHGISVYSPHTSWDAVSTGINDWLISAFGQGTLNIHVKRSVRDESNRMLLLSCIADKVERKCSIVCTCIRR